MFMYAIACAFYVGSSPCRRIFYWALLTSLWDPHLGTGYIQGDGAPTRP